METILCPGCGEENPARFRLCGFCGTTLAPVPEIVQCPSCGEENPGKFRLCGYCGTPLGTQPPVGPSEAPAVGRVGGPPGPAAPAAPVAPATPASVAPSVALPAREVRKLVTLVFSDLKDSTALTASIDAEAMNEIKARYFATMAAEIERHGGKVEKNIGDAIMAVFGLIRAREDDALRAVQAAAGMQHALAELNDELSRLYGVTLTNRTGVNTGEIVANTDPSATQNLATGDAVNVAARLEQNAPANEILMGEMTHALVRDNVEAERLELQLKGKAEPVPAYRLVAVRSEPAAERTTAAAPFIGRQFELNVLTGAFAEIAGTPLPRLVTVIGDAGVGKTRLVADFLRQVADQATILRGRCLAWGEGITFWPLLEVVREAAAIGEDDSTEAARNKVAGLVPSSDPDHDAIVDRVASAIGLAGGSFPVAELFWGARKLLESQAANRPLVVVIDDIHWAEETFLDFLGHVVESARSASILLVCTARSELLDENQSWADQPRFQRIDLKPLGASDVEAMIDALLGEANLSGAVRAKVVAAAEGNPLYVEQMVSHLRERAGEHDGEIVVPPTIHALLAARLDALTHEERAIVDPASVIGLVFPEPAIEELVPDAIRPAVTAYLSGLERKQFVHALDGGDDPAFRFHHILVRDAAYQSLLKRARATLHERFVTWAERVNRERDRETEFEEILGYHLEQAVRYRSELGPLDATGREIAGRAATKLANAGRRAFSRGDTPAACNLLRRAAVLLPTDGPTRIELLTELADALMEEGAFDEAATYLDEAGEAAARIGDERLRARATLGRRTLDLHVSAGGIGDVLAAAAGAIATFEAADDEAGLARAWRLLMLVHGTTGAYDEAASAAKLVVEHARAAGDARLATRGAIGYAVSALHGPTPASEALRRSEQLVADVAGDRKAEAVISGVLAQLHAMHGDFERGRELYGRARSMLHDLGPSVTAASTSTESSRVEILAGDVAAAERELRRDHAALTELGEQYYLSTVAALLAGVLEARDELAEAEALSRSAEALADNDDVFSQVAWRGARARILARTDHPEEAERLAREAVELAAGTVDITLHADALVDLATVLTRIGREGDAEARWSEALVLYERKEDVVSAERVRGRLAEAVRA